MSRPVVLITGCSRGIGHAAALRLSGSHSVIATLRGDEGRAALLSAGVEVASLDVTDRAACFAVVEGIVARHGRLDAVVANAGAGLFGCFEDVDEAQARALFDVNVHGVFNTAAAALPQLRASQGRLIVISSIAGRRSAPGSSLYNATKFALEGWAEALCFELDPFGVKVVLIEPGPTASGFVGAASRGSRVGTGPYSAITAKLMALRQAAMGKPEPVDTVTAALEQALTAKNPGLRHPTGRGTAAQILAARMLPWKVYAAVVRRKIKLDQG